MGVQEKMWKSAALISPAERAGPSRSPYQQFNQSTALALWRMFITHHGIE
jgi:hypothetical protein